MLALAVAAVSTAPLEPRVRQGADTSVGRILADPRFSTAWAALERDHEFLLKGDVFTRDLIEMWLDYKREQEVQAMRLRPTPYEFFMYYDI